MTLDKQIVPVDFEQSSVDAKADPKVKGKFTRIENMFKKRTGELRKRYGFDQIPSTVFSGDTTITNDIYVQDFNNELVAMTSSSIYSYSEAKDTWKAIDSNFKLWTTDSFKTTIARDYKVAQVATSPDYYCVAGAYFYGDTGGTSQMQATYSVYDRLTGSIVIPESTLNVKLSNTNPQLKVDYNISITSAPSFIISFINANDDLAFRVIYTSDLSLGYFTIAGTFKALDTFYDTSYIKFYVYANDNGTGKLYYINPDTMATITSASIGSMTAATATLRLSDKPNFIVGEGIAVYYCDFVGTDKKPYIGLYDKSTLAAIKAITAMPTVTTTTAIEMETFTGYIQGFAQGQFKVLIGSSYLLIESVWDWSSHTSYTVNTYYGLKTQGKCFMHGSTPYCMMSQGFNTAIANYELQQQTCYLVNLNTWAFMVAKNFTQNWNAEGVISVGNFYSAPNTTAVSNYSTPYSDGTSIYYGCIQKTDNVNKAISVKRIYSDITKLSMPAKTSNEVIIPGLMPLSYTGSELVETSTSCIPQIISYTDSGGGAGLPNGKYAYYAIATHVDRNGIKRRSALSNNLAFTKTNTNDWAINIIGLPLGRNCQNIEIYRTVDSGSIYYLAGILTDPGMSTKYLVDRVTDATIISNEILYTTGGVLETELPNNCSILKVLGDRLFMARCEDQDKVFYSKELSANIAPEFSSFNVIEFFDHEGPIVGCAELDEKYFFFKEETIFYCFGQLNDDTGQGQNVTPLKIPGNIGLTDYQAIVQFNEGIIFKSARGFYLIDRGLNLSYIGAPVEYFNSVAITSSVVMSANNQIRFTSTSGTCLVYDYFWKEWYVYTNILATSATNWDGSFVFAKTNGTFFKENEAKWTDVSTSIVSKIETSWLDMNGVQGLQRIYRGLILGEYRGAHTLKISVATDFKPYFDEQFFISTSALTGPVTSDASFYTNYATGSTDSVYQFQFRPKNQKCQSMQLIIEDSFSSGNEGFTISGISFIVGQKKGVFKLPATKTMTPS